jgi:hypothetical protein
MPETSFESFSKTGEMALHGPHHAAQKSMATTLPDLIYVVDQRTGTTELSEAALRTTLLNCSFEVIAVTVISTLYG